jgi:hypothetical protein
VNENNFLSILGNGVGVRGGLKKKPVEQVDLKTGKVVARFSSGTRAFQATSKT